jgi:hypothetical protein
VVRKYRKDNDGGPLVLVGIATATMRDGGPKDRLYDARLPGSKHDGPTGARHHLHHRPGHGNRIQEIDPLGQTNEWTYDAHGK